MNWRYTILNNRTTVATEIEEPPGSDQNTAAINRDRDYHGVFFSNQGEAFEFHGTAGRLIEAEYEQYGREGDMTLIMEENCGLEYVEFSRGRFDFNKYKRYCGDAGCYVKIPVEKAGEVVELRARLNQKVNLEAVKAFDGVTDLPVYSKLPFSMPLPSKGIFMQNTADWAEEQLTVVSMAETIPLFIPTVDLRTYAWFQIVPQIENIKFSEFGRFTTAASPEHQFIKADQNPAATDAALALVIDGNFGTPPDTQKIYFDWATASPLLVNDGNANGFDTVKKFSCVISYSFELQLTYPCIGALYNVLIIRRKAGTYEYLDKQRIVCGVAGGGSYGFDEATTWQAGTTYTINYTATRENLHLADGDYLFVAVCGLAYFANFDLIHQEAYKIRSISGSVKMETLSHSSATATSVFAVNEVLSRIAESITNNKLKAYSEYFGRTDSQPYALPSDGCGGLEVVVDGIRVRRQENKIPGKTNTFSLSLQDMFEGLNPIHNIGMSIEPDTLRPGFNRLRVEPWYHFYNNNVIMSCTGVNNITREADDKEVYSTFQFGYGKWEAEEYNGLDEFLTKRMYRTTLSQVKNDLVKLSKFIASGYALEVTKRKGNDNTKDWRYDKETFIICCSRHPKFTVKFTAATDDMQASLTFDFFGDPAAVFDTGIGGSFPVTVLGSQYNDGVITCSGYNYVANVLTLLVFSPAITDEETNGVQFPDAIFPDGQLYVEQGNITASSNIIDPGTLYNYRISPLRNAMRWMNRVFESYRQFGADCKLLFTDGDGNYFAAGKMEDAACRMEAGIITENQTIDVASFADENRVKPLLLPERVVFEYPMSTMDYKRIVANPEGLVYFQNDCEEGFGFIDTIQYKMEDGRATYNLIPAITAAIPGDPTHRAILTESGYDIITEGGEYFEIQH